MADDKDLYGIPIIGGLNPESDSQPVNFITKLFAEMKTELAKRPAEEDPLTSKVYRTWDRRLMMAIGAINGAIRFAQAFGMITPQQFGKLQLEAMGILARAMAVVDMGNRR